MRNRVVAAFIGVGIVDGVFGDGRYGYFCSGDSRSLRIGDGAEDAAEECASDGDSPDDGAELDA